METCKYCNDMRFIVRKGREVIHKSGKVVGYSEDRVPCICFSLDQLKIKNPALTVIDSLDFETITSFKDIYKEKFVLFTGDKYQFLKAAACRGVVYKNEHFSLNNSTYYLESYYLPQPDQSIVRGSDLDSFDFLAISLDSSTKNVTMTTTVADIVSRRLSLKKALWLYSKSQEHLRVSQECSDYLIESLEGAKHTHLNREHVIGNKNKSTLSKKLAAKAAASDH